MRTFAGIEATLATSNAEIWLQSIPYDGTSTWGKGADQGFAAFLDASENMELYDIETDSEAYKHGIHIIDAILEKSTPEAVFEAVYTSTSQLVRENKFLTFFGGEHSISIGIIKAFYEYFENLTIVQLDAHTDLRPTFDGSNFNHACAMHDASRNANLVQVGIRSMDQSEKAFQQPDNVFYAHELQGEWIKEALSRTTNTIYLTIDLDVFDPSIMPATGTPEPGGLSWEMVTGFCRELFTHRNVVGFDLVELAPINGLRYPQFLAAKLYYKLLSYKFER